MEIDRFICDHDESPRSNIWIIDDPSDDFEIEKWLKRAEDENTVVIIAFDPCQLNSFDSRGKTTGIGDKQYDIMCQKFDAYP